MSSKLLDEFVENGFVVIDDFLTPEEVEELHNAGKKLCLEAPQEERKIFSTVNSEVAHSRDTYFIESGDKIRYFYESDALNENGDLLVDPLVALNKVGHALHTDHPIFKKITFSDQIRELCWQLGYKRPAIPQSMYIYKNPKIGGEIIPHQDSAYIHTEPLSALGFWIALEDATIQNGCLQFIKGSHKNGVHRRYIRNPDKSSPELIVYDKPSIFYPQSQFVKVPISKGSCILIHGEVVHRSDQNRSPNSRHAYTFHIIETENTKFSKDNWLQPPEGKPFPILYEKKE